VPSPEVRALREFYGPLPQPPNDPFQFFLWEILSADALSARRDLAWHALRRVPALTPDAVFRLPTKSLQETLAILGSNRDERVELVRATVGEFKRHRDELEAHAFAQAGLRRAFRSLQRLRHLPPDVRERALLYAGSYAVLPLDDGAARVVARLHGTAIPVHEGAEGFTLKRALWSGELRQQRRRARRLLTRRLPADVSTYRETLLYYRHHASHTCLAVGPHCAVCPLATGCAFTAAQSAQTS
jgi:endonuclease III